MSRRLLFLTERYPPDFGGVAASSGRIARALVSLGFEVDVVTWTRMAEPGAVIREDGPPRVFRMGRFRAWDTTMPHTEILLDWLAGLKRYDAVWGHYLFPGGFLAAWFSLRRGVPSVVSVRGNDIDRDMFPPGDFARLKWTLSQATVATAVTRELVAKAGALADRGDVVHLPNAVDTDVFAPAPPASREQLGVRPDEVVLGFNGELREKKGQKHLLEALRFVQERRPACLLIIGEVRPSEASTPLQAAPQERRILITGRLADPAAVNAHLQLCDVYLQPSLWDGMPNALLEAMSAGCGAIGSDAGGIPELITPGVNGVIVPRWQLHRLGEAVLEWLDAPQEVRDRIRAAARAHMLAEFSLARERARLQALLDRVIPSAS